MHWKHSRYQILNTIVANCHTYDEAYRVLRELEEDRSLSIDLALAESNRAKAKVLSSKTILNDDEEQQYNKLRSQADLDETRARRDVAQACLDEARRELEFIRELIVLIDPHRTYKDLPDYEAHQRIQFLEWKLDLVWKSYSMICAVGNISYDHFISIKMHPHADKIMPVINEFLSMSRTGEHDKLLSFTKNDVFSKVCSEQEIYIASPISHTLELHYELPGTTVATAGLEFKDSGTE